MKTVRFLFILMVIGFCLYTGCTEQQQYAKLKQICVEHAGREEVFKAAEDTLGRMNFDIAKQDEETGYIKTRPLRAAQSFEFWRSDNVGKFNTAEANLHTIRRTVELTVMQKKGYICIACDVQVQRLSLSGYGKQRGSETYERFSDRRILRSELKLDAAKKQWINLGSDKQLGALILRRIEEQLGKQKEKDL